MINILLVAHIDHEPYLAHQPEFGVNILHAYSFEQALRLLPTAHGFMIEMMIRSGNQAAGQPLPFGLLLYSRAVKAGKPAVLLCRDYQREKGDFVRGYARVNLGERIWLERLENDGTERKYRKIYEDLVAKIRNQKPLM